MNRGEVLKDSIDRVLTELVAGAPAISTAPCLALARDIAAYLSEQGVSALASLLQDGLSAAARRIDSVTVVATGLGWLGAGVESIERQATEMLASAHREVILTAYLITAGSERVLSALVDALESGVAVKLLVNQLETQDSEVRHAIEQIGRRFPTTFKLSNFTGGGEGGILHAKVLVVDRARALVGSSNLTLNGMVRSHELALFVEGPAADRVAACVDLLLQSKYMASAEGRAAGYPEA
jgi:phosphatidylserine/phosphatidylglycerophosphate/cardiolipin synthase-like enzyme